MKTEATTIAEAVREALRFFARKNKPTTGAQLIWYVETYYAGREWKLVSIKAVIAQMQRPQTLRRLDANRLHMKRSYRRIERVGMHHAV